MDTTRYKELRRNRKNLEIVFEYYLSKGGIIKDISRFNQLIKTWFFYIDPIGSMRGQDSMTKVERFVFGQWDKKFEYEN